MVDCLLFLFVGKGCGSTRCTHFSPVHRAIYVFDSSSTTSGLSIQRDCIPPRWKVGPTSISIPQSSLGGHVLVIVVCFIPSLQPAYASFRGVVPSNKETRQFSTVLTTEYISKICLFSCQHNLLNWQHWNMCKLSQNTNLKIRILCLSTWFNNTADKHSLSKSKCYINYILQARGRFTFILKHELRSLLKTLRIPWSWTAEQQYKSCSFTWFSVQE